MPCRTAPWPLQAYAEHCTWDPGEWRKKQPTPEPRVRVARDSAELEMAVWQVPNMVEVPRMEQQGYRRGWDLEQVAPK